MYDEPQFDEEGNLIKDTLSEEDIKRKLQISLNNDVLMTNCGVPIIFVINKSDNPCQKYEDKNEFILRHIRKSAINYGATVIYTSTKSNTNITVLYDYIFHSLFNFDLVHKSNMIDKNSYFIPSGYDRLSVLKSNDSQHELDYEFTDIIKEEKEEEKIEDEIKCEKVSDFFQKVKDRVYRSRKSMIREDLKIGKAGEKKDYKKKDTLEKALEKEKDKKPPVEKVNKFEKFLDKNKHTEPEGEKEKLSKEERQKKTRESLLNKLNLSKKNKK